MNLDAVRERSGACEKTRDSGSHEAWTLAAIASAADVPALLAEIERLRTALAEETSSHEQTFQNFSDWIEDHQARSFRITPPTQTTGWAWNCLRCTAEGSFSREPDAFGAAVAHEHRNHREAS